MHRDVNRRASSTSPPQVTESTGWVGLMKKSPQSGSETKGSTAGKNWSGVVQGRQTHQTSSKSELRRIPVFVVLPPRLLLLDIAGPLEVLRQANRVQTAVRFDVQYVGPSKSLLTSIGVTLNAIQQLPDELPPEAWVVLAGDVEHVMLCGGGAGPGKTAADERDED